MTPYRFDAFHRGNDDWTFACLDLTADSARNLARLLVESDFPDGPVEGGRLGRLDWSYPSLHRFAASGVAGPDAERWPERLHPALRAAVVALGVLRAARRAQAALLALAVCAGLCGALPAGAAPPRPGTEDYEVLLPFGEWIRNLRANGRLCCDWSDTRPVKSRTVGDRYQVWLRKDQIIGAPVEQWLDVPDDAVIRGHNPVGMAIVSYYGDRVQCFVPPGGI